MYDTYMIRKSVIQTTQKCRQLAKTMYFADSIGIHLLHLKYHRRWSHHRSDATSWLDIESETFTDDILEESISIQSK